MGSDDLFRKNKLNRKRQRKDKKLKKRISIVCQGEKTEPGYFQSFPIVTKEVQIEVSAKTPLQIVKRAEEIMKQAQKDDVPFDSVWCVFDRDDFPKANFGTALKWAEELGIKIAWSVECFELWYLLHFEYLQAALPRKEYAKKLSRHLGRKYSKKNKLYEVLLPHQERAIRNAKKLFKQYPDHIKAFDRNPVTMVFALVEELNSMMD